MGLLILVALILLFGGEDPHERELEEMDRHEELLDRLDSLEDELLDRDDDY